MENKKYLDKVLDHLVRSTEIDYENESISVSFSPSISSRSFSSSFLFSLFPPSLSIRSSLLSYFYDYCKNQFGLTKDEIGYVFVKWVDVLKDKYDKHNIKKI